MSDVKEDIKFLQEYSDLKEEFDEAHEVRKSDPQRWDEAKHAFQEYRTYWKQIREALSANNAEDTVTPQSATPSVEIHGEEV